MYFLYPIIFGIIQGLTEFLPVSSSGHLVLLHDILNFRVQDSLSFDVALHLGTLIALILFFKFDIYKLIKAWFRSLFKWNLKEDMDGRLAWFIFAATIPAVIVGYFFEDKIISFLRSSLSVSIMLIAGGVLLIIFDRYGRKTDTFTSLTLGKSIFIGLAQAIALIPGVSRSGITIIAGLWIRLNRAAAARFSFLLSIPVVFGAGAKKIYDLGSDSISYSSEAPIFILGFISSAVVGFFCIKYFLRFLDKHSFRVFGWYRIVLALIIIVYLFIFK